MPPSEQATNSQPEASPEARVEASLFKSFGGEDPPPAQPAKPRGADGKFAPQGQQEAKEEVPAEAEGQEAEAPEQEASQAQPEEVEVEIEGETYIVPKKISDRFIQHADYTRKTQDIAEMRRALSAEREAVSIEKGFQNAVAEESTQLALINAQLAAYSKVDWSTLETEQLIRTRAQLDQLKESKAAIEATIKAKREDFDSKINGALKEALSAGEKYIVQHIKSYDEKTKKAIFEYGLAEGYTRQELERVIDPRVVVSLWKAKQWDELQASKPGFTNRAASRAPVLRPGARQTQPSKVTQLLGNAKKAATPNAKKQAFEDYFAERLSGRK